jgi:hypothetical protein
MKYLFLAYADERHWSTLPVSERAAIETACRVNDQALRESGYLLAAPGLYGSSTATTVRFQNGRVSLTDGPFAETREQLIGLFFINARDLNEAILVASKMPQARRGPIEVRPVMAADKPSTQGA